MKQFLKIFKDYDIMLLTICTAVVFLANLIALEGFWLHRIISNRYIVVVILYVLVWLMFKKQNMNDIENDMKKNRRIFWGIWATFFISVLISKIINKGSNIIDILLMLSIVPFFFFIKNMYNIDKHLNIACIINLLPLLLILKGGNALALLITIIGITVINTTIRKLAEKGYIVTYVFIVAIFLLFIAITKCRTAMISFLLIAGINYIYILTQKKFYIKKIIITILIMLLLILLTGNIKEFLFNKYQSHGDITTGRSKIWENVIKDEISLFGHEDDYFTNIANKADAHNVYIQIWGHYGIIPLCLYIILNIYILFRIFKKKKKLEYINFFGNYFIISMFENILFIDTKIVIYNILVLAYINKLLKDEENTSEDDWPYGKIIINIWNKIKELEIIDKLIKLKEKKNENRL